MLFERVRGLFRTLRFRLMAWNVVVVLAIVCSTLFVVREVLSRALLHEVNQRLEEDTQEIALTLRRYYPEMQPAHEELDRRAIGHKLEGWFVQLLDERGQVKWSSQNTPGIEMPHLPAHGTASASVTSFRIAQATVELPNTKTMLIRVGTSSVPMEEDVSLLTKSLILVGGVILLVLPLGGYWLSGRATEPLARIIQTTAQLRPSNLDERLPLRQTGDELDQLSQTINGMLDRIAEYLDQKRDFLANAAHELRSPLAAIHSTVEVALNSERSPEEYVGLLGEVLEECSSLSTLVNQLLLLAEGDAGRLSLRDGTVQLDRLVCKSVEMFRGVAESEGVKLVVARAHGVFVRGDETHLRQVVNNLIDNAIKFTPAGGQVEVGVQAGEGNDPARLWVWDTGVGISTEELPRIFERFYQSDKSRPRETRQRGTGLGLSICQSIIAALGGRIDVESTLGKGSKFTIYLKPLNV